MVVHFLITQIHLAVKNSPMHEKEASRIPERGRLQSERCCVGYLFHLMTLSELQTDVMNNLTSLIIGACIPELQSPEHYSYTKAESTKAVTAAA